MSKKFKSLEDAIVKIRKAGFFVTSLSELTRDVWSASLRPSGISTTSYGQGNTALEAMQAAYDCRTKEDAWNRDLPVTPRKPTARKAVTRAKMPRGGKLL